MPDVFVDPDRVHADQPVGVVGEHGQDRLDRLPDGVPVHPEPTSHGGDRGGVALDAADRPPRRPDGEFRPRRGQVVVLTEPADRAGRLGASVPALPPLQLDRRTERRNVVQLTQPSPAGLGDHPAARTTHPGRIGFHHQPQPGGEPAATLAPGDIEHMRARQIEQGIDARAVADRIHAARRRLSHRRGPSAGSLVATDPGRPRLLPAGTTRSNRLFDL